MLVFDFFAGTGSSTKAFADRGHTVIRFELDEQFQADEHVDVASLNFDDLIARYGRPDFVWASPPCTAFSVASIGRHWYEPGKPKTEAAKYAQELVASTVELIHGLNPSLGWLMENPRGMLRKLPVVAHLPRQTVTYCTYGDFRMKPTDLWGGVPGWTPRPACKNGDTCHVSAPRGSRTGTQGMMSPEVKAMIPYDLGDEICDAAEALIREREQ
jgi:hypothetical protein